MKFSNISFFEGLKPSSINKQYKQFQRPWGYYQILYETPIYKIKKLFINPYSQISLQSHKKRTEHWVVVSGIASVILNGKEITLHTEQSITIPQKAKHRLSNKTNKFLIVIETQMGTYLGEDDIVRHEDMYNRK